jgi:hypothetical protein
MVKQLQLHRDSGIHIYDDAARAGVYREALEQAGQDTGLVIKWPMPDIVRIFPLEDGRIAIIRRTAAGLSQEAASEPISELYNTLAARVDVMVQQGLSRAKQRKLPALTSEELVSGLQSS